MLSSKLYFKIPSNTTLDTIGSYQLHVYNEYKEPFSVTISSGKEYVDVILIKHNEIDSIISIDIKESNAEFTINIENEYGLTDSTTLNSGEPLNYFKLREYKNRISYSGETLRIYYDIKGYSPYDVDAIFDELTVIPNKAPFPTYTSEGDDYGTFITEYNNTVDIYGHTSMDDKGTLVFSKSNIKPYGLYNKLKETGYEYVSVDFSALPKVEDTPIAPRRTPTLEETEQIYQGLAAVGSGFTAIAVNEGVFISDYYHNMNERYIEFKCELNPLNTTKEQEITISCEDIAYTFTLIQEPNPNGEYFDYDPKTIPSQFNEVINRVNINLDFPSYYKFRVNTFNPNATFIKNPYTVTYEVPTDGNYITLLINGLKLSDNLSPQYMQFGISLYDDYGYEASKNVDLMINANGVIYGSGNIYVDNISNRYGGLVLDNNVAVDFRINGLPSWLKEEDFVLEDNTLKLISIEPNNTNEKRETNVTVSFIKSNGSLYENTLSFSLSQDVTIQSSGEHRKTFEDVYIENEEYPNISEITVSTDEKTLYSGYFVDKLNLQPFTTSLFDEKKNIFKNSYTNLGLNESLYYDVNGSIKNIWFTYDYSYDNENHQNITEIKQPIDYFDPRQYVFESIWHCKDNVSKIYLNDREYTNIKKWEKYNIVLDANVSYLYVQLKTMLGRTLVEGKKFYNKCTNANYAVYYMNTYGGWNWMLFEGNKQIEKQTNKFSSILNYNNENVPYKVDTASSYELTSLFLTDEGSDKLQDLYKSPMVYLHKLGTNDIIRVNVDTKSYSIKTYINQGRKFFTQNITLTESKNKPIF